MKGMIDGQRNEILFMGSSSPHMFEFMMVPLLPSESNGEIPKYYSWHGILFPSHGSIAF
jgi:hypothetical protein